MAINNLVIEETNKVNVLTDRVQKCKQRYEEASLWISSLRAHAVTESWKETEADPIHLRWAKAFARIMEDSPIIIRDSELIVGSETKYIRGAEVVAEYLPYDILDSLEKGCFEGMSEVVSAGTEEEERKLLEEAAHYWVGKSMRDIINEAWRRELGEEFFNMIDEKTRVYEIGINIGPKGSTTFNPRVLKEGLNGIIARAKYEKKRTVSSCGGWPSLSPTIYHKTIVLNSIIIACEAVIQYAKKHAEIFWVIDRLLSRFI